MASNIYSASLSAMNAAQFGLSATEHNIANANTPGYTRQVVEVQARAAQQTGAGFLGQGVDVTTVKRIYDEFLTTQVRQEQTQATYLSTYYTQMTQIDNMLADPLAGASPAMQQFFDSLNAVANNPESVPARQTLLNSAQFAVSRFQAIDQRLTEIGNGVNGQISNTVGTINSYAQQIAALNGNIKRATASSGGQLPNDLIDQRDQLINLMNQELKATVQPQSDGTVAVFVGTGQPVVVDETAYALRVTQSTADPNKLDVSYVSQGKIVPLQTTTLQGGNLGAYIAFRDQNLKTSRSALGRVAMGFASSLNSQNQMGLDMNGNPGAAMFKVGVPAVTQNATNNGTAVMAATITNVAALTASDYQVRFDGTNYTAVRLSDNLITNIGTAATPPTNFALDGLSITLSVGAKQGDSFLIRPTANGARDISVNFTDPAQLAAAAPVRSESPLTNTGNGLISAAAVTGGLPLNANLSQPFSLTFNNPPSTYSLTSTNASVAVETGPGGTSLVTVPSTANMLVGDPIVGGGFPAGTTISAIAADGVTFTAQLPAGGVTSPPAPSTGQTLQIGSYAYTAGANISYNGWTVQISGQPAAGDVFNVVPNTNATGDGSNALALAALQNTNVLANGTTSFQGAYGQLVAQIGAKTNELSITSQAQTSMLNSTVAQQQAVSGVNLDEEAANLLRYQRAYQAAAKAMQIANTMFDAILGLGK